MAGPTIRAAKVADANRISAVLIASITELCRADHGDQTDVIAKWTANKTPDHIRCWFGNERIQLFVAEREHSIAGVGACDTQGRIVLNYVHPKHQRKGVSRALSHEMERHLAATEPVTASLTATQTALGFYLANGWQRSGPPRHDFGVPGFPMEKSLMQNKRRD